MGSTNQDESLVVSPISFTDGAVKELMKITQEQNSGLRVGFQGGGCAGLNYVLEFDSKKEGDREYSYRGITFYINEVHLPSLNGMEIDYRDGLHSRGFVFTNPNAKRTCGCGISFEV